MGLMGVLKGLNGVSGSSIDVSASAHGVVLQGFRALQRVSEGYRGSQECSKGSQPQGR